MADTPLSRSERKRQVIMEAATTVFLRNGYLGTSMDQVAALAAVSKQTVYKHFADKEALFAEIIQGTVGQADELEKTITALLQNPGDLATDLGQLARWLLRFLTEPAVRQLRRLVVGEAGRFPQLGRAWYAEGFERGMVGLATYLQGLAARGKLHVEDPLLAAHHFAGLVLWAPVNRVMFCGDDERVTDAEIDRYAKAGVRAFLAAYGTGQS